MRPHSLKSTRKPVLGVGGMRLGRWWGSWSGSPGAGAKKVLGRPREPCGSGPLRCSKSRLEWDGDSRMTQELEAKEAASLSHGVPVL